ncbi:cytidylate kinase [Lachnospiraceae bacterium PF1-22]|uniref:cytidylate kinase-like family protein n=1 Tax=Ohessyouella blattaphilus TaxID=2949333 RepID=UPI003E2ADF25
MEKNIVFTIAREYGSGGRTIGKMLAERLDIPFYDREILRMASDESGISELLFAEADEKLKGNLLFNISRSVYDGSVLGPDSDDYASTKNLFNFQAKVIKELAKSQSCVIVGRCADFILKDYDNVIRIFIYADEEFNFNRAMERNSMTEGEMRKYIAKRNKYRGDYYKHYTGRDWHDARQYDLCLNSGKLGFEKTLQSILSYRQIRFED